MAYGIGEKVDTPTWSVEDAPVRYIELLRKGIIGIAVEITELAERFTMSQERGIGDRSGVVEGLKGVNGGFGKVMVEIAMRRELEYDLVKAEKRPER